MGELKWTLVMALFVLLFAVGMHFWGYVDGYRAALVELLTAEKDKARGEQQ